MSKLKLVVLFIIIFGVLGICGFYIFNISRDLKAEDAIKNEFSQILILNKNKEENKAQIDEILNRRVTTGYYKEVESASKRYLKDLYTYIDNINYLVSSEYVNYLSIENIKNNREDDFKASIEAIDNTKKQTSDNINKLILMVSDDTTIMSYLDGNLKKYYVSFYKDLVYGSSIDEEYINNKYGYIIERLEYYKEALKYLADNKKYWKIPETLGGNSILFDNAEIENGYKEIVENIKGVSKNITEVEE